MFYSPPVDYDELEKLPKAGGRTAVTPDRLPGLVDAGGRIELPEVLSLLAIAGGADCAGFAGLDGSYLASIAVAGGRAPVGTWLTRWVPYGDWQVSVDRRAASVDLEGYPEYAGHASTPPRFYRRKEFAGVVVTCFSASFCPSLSDATNWTFPWKFSGHHLWSGAKTAQKTGAEWFDTYGPACILPGPNDDIWSQDWWDANAGGAVLTSYPVDDLHDGMNAQFKTLFPVSTVGATERRISSIGCVGDAQVGYRSGYGSASETLTDEHEPLAAFLAAIDALPWQPNRTWTPGGADVASGFAWTGAGQPRRWSGWQERWEIELTGLEIGTRYLVTWETSDEGRQEVDFVAVATTRRISATVPCGETATGWAVEKLERYFVGGEDMGLDNIATAGRGKMDCGPDRLTGLATAGGLTGGEVMDRLAGLASGGVPGMPLPVVEAAGALLEALSEAGGGDACDWPWHVILALLGYPEIDWGPWADRFGPGAFLPPGVITFGGLPLTFLGDFLTYLEED